VVVIGLGRFGLALAEGLQDQGHEVLGIDLTSQLVQAASRSLTYVVQGDATDPEVLRQLGVGDVRHGVVAIGDDIQSSILAAANLADLGLPEIWAKAVTVQHARILERVGATSVVFPERDMGRRVAHRVAGNVLEYFQVDEDFVLVETPVPARHAGRTLGEARIREADGVTVVAVRPPGGSFAHPAPDSVLEDGALLLVGGTTAQVQAFTRRR
jgi:trk system potassium uptake protein TrkA